MRSTTNRDRRGSALTAVLLILVVLAGMCAAVVSTSLLRQGAARSMHEQERAFQAAMTGLDIAVYEIQEGVDLDSNGIGNAVGDVGGEAYAVTIDPAFSGGGEYTLQAAGQFGPSRQGIEVVIAADDSFPFGVFARDGINMSGGFSVDSYNSSAGTYASQVSGSHAGDEGNLGSNGDIKAGGGIVYGDATPGPGFQVTGDPSNVMGSTAPATTPFHPDPYVYSPPIASSGDWSGPGTITAGTYRFDEFNVSGGNTVVISGDVTLYVDDKFTSSGGSILQVQPGASLVIHHGSSDFKVSGGGVVNESQEPGNVQLFSATEKKVELSGGSDFYGLLYAPEAEFVASGSSQLFGRFIAASAKFSSGGGRLHVDTSLSVGGGGGDGFNVKSARRISPPRM